VNNGGAVSGNMEGDGVGNNNRATWNHQLHNTDMELEQML